MSKINSQVQSENGDNPPIPPNDDLQPEIDPGYFERAMREEEESL